MSQNGAKLIFYDATAVPSEFDIVIQRKGHSRRARVTWRTSTQAGIQFLDRRAPATLPIEAVRQIRKLKDERATLVERLAKFSDTA